MDHSPSPTQDHGASHATLSAYVLGFGLSLALTLESYYVVVHHTLMGTTLITAIIALALVQLVVQLVFFLHIGKGAESRWNLAVFFFALITVLILVCGSIWIMYGLNSHMTPTQVNSYMDSQDSL